MKSKAGDSGSFRLSDLIIIIVFLSIAAFSVEMFRSDLLQTFSLRNVEPAGTIIIKKNTVQRRLSDRMVWDRLAKESPVYIGDLIRVADLSAATLNIDDNSIDLSENTLVRISSGADGEGIQLMLSEGAVSLAAGTEGRNVSLNLNGVQVQAARGSVLSAGAREAGGVSVQVNEGNAQIVEARGTVRAISSGNVIAVASDGTQVPAKTAVVTQPVPNARYVKPAKEPLAVNFSWSRINLAPEEKLRLEISADRYFTRISNKIENLDSRAQARFDTGFWHWRLLFENTVLSSGSLTIADGSGPELQSPAFNSLFTYRDEPPAINFQWARVEEAVSYIIEVSNTSNFANVQIRRQSPAASMIASGLEEGMWFWRVMPVFPSVFSGSANYSTVSFFRIERLTAAPAVVAQGAAGGGAISLSQWLSGQAPSTVLPPELPPEITPPQLTKAPELTPPIPKINLSSPAQGAQIDGLPALRQQTVFRWNTTGEFASSRFVLSRNANPLEGQTEREIPNVNNISRVDSLTEGTWYWTVELRTSNGVAVSAPPQSFQVLPIPLLPSPRSLQPAAGRIFGLQDFRSQRSIVFSWSNVQGANAYIFTLYQQTTRGRRQIASQTISNRTNYSFTDLQLLDRGTFVWQVEAVNMRANVIEQRGATGESTFTIDFPSSAPLQVEDSGVLYGN